MARLHDYRMCGSDEIEFDIAAHLGESGGIIIPIISNNKGQVMFIYCSPIEAKDLITHIETALI